MQTEQIYVLFIDHVSLLRLSIVDEFGCSLIKKQINKIKFITTTIKCDKDSRWTVHRSVKIFNAV